MLVIGCALVASGIRMRGRKSTPGRYFKVAEPGSGWGGTDVTDAFRLYLRPLLGSGMPDAFRLRPNPVAKVLKR